LQAVLAKLAYVIDHQSPLVIPTAIAYNSCMGVLKKPKTGADHGTEVLDPVTLAALEDGLKMAAANPRRWTPEEVRHDARELASTSPSPFRNLHR
jgi:hypothetical protein